MFSGIVEEIGRIVGIEREGENVHFDVAASFLDEIKIDQSIAHNGACLTVVAIHADSYRVTAISETLQKTNLADLQSGDGVNLERCMKLGDRVDGHMVQGHVDGVAACVKIEDQLGSWKFTFEYVDSFEWATVKKGSICVNGVSLTVVDSWTDGFSVCIIPYTYEHTTFQFLHEGSRVNLEFDMIGKYVHQFLQSGR